MLWEFLAGNSSVTVPILVLILGALALRWRYVRAIVRMAQAAYRIAEEEGLLKDLKGVQKAAPFLEAFFAKWTEKTGADTPPPPSAQALAMKVAAATAAADKGKV